MESMLDLAAERKRLQKEMTEIQSAIAQLEARLKDSNFLAKAPKAVIDKEQDKLTLRKSKLERLRQQLDSFRTGETE
jgi:valyl-tRNA synthetase